MAQSFCASEVRSTLVASLCLGIAVLHCSASPAAAAEAIAAPERPPLTISRLRPDTPLGVLAQKMVEPASRTPFPSFPRDAVPGSAADPVPGGFAATPAVSVAVAPERQAAATPPATVTGVSDSEVRFGLSAPLSGPQRDLGHQIRQGIQAAFSAQNDVGGVFGRKLVLVARDDGYEPDRALVAARDLHEQARVFATVGDVGTATAAISLPYALSAEMPKLFAFSGANVLRNVPPDRFVFNLRASYAEETEAAVRYLVNVRGFKPRDIAVLAQDDAFGQSGLDGVRKAMRGLAGGFVEPFLVMTYKRNSADVSDAVAKLRAASRRGGPRAVVMIAAYKAAAQFIALTKPSFPGMVYTDVSFAGSTQLADELVGLGRGLAEGVVVTQVVPSPDGHSKEVDRYRAAMAKYFPGESVDYVSLEGWLDARLLIEGLTRAGRNLTPEALSDALESIRGQDLGMGDPVVLTSSDHQGSHHVWGTMMDANGHYQPLDLR